jgi:hypothetical protein
MTKVVVVEYTTGLIKLVIHEVLYADVVVLYTADPKVVMT